MSAYKKVKIGLITELEAPDLRSLLQTWAFARIIENYWPRMRILCGPNAEKLPDFLEKHFQPLYLRGIFELSGLNVDACVTVSGQLFGNWKTKKPDSLTFQMFQKEKVCKLVLGAVQVPAARNPLARKRVRYLLDDFTTIGAASEAERKLLSSMTSAEVRTFCDPMLLATRAQYKSIAQEEVLSAPVKEGEQTKAAKYLLVHMKEQPEKTKEQIEELAKRLKLKIVHNQNGVAYERKLAHYSETEPERYLGLLEKAAFVVTDQYCSVVTASLFGRPFVLLDGGTEAEAATWYLEQVALGDHIVKNLEQITELAPYRFSPEKKTEFRARALALREEATSFLEERLALLPKVNCPTGVKKIDCCGCRACAELCPQGAITMETDKEGFAYPVVDQTRCTDCGLCAKHCIAASEKQRVAYEAHYPVVLAAINRDMETRMKSTSGGVFRALAQQVIEKEGGVVFGVRYDEKMQVITVPAQTMEEAKAFSGSKYVKSDTSGAYPQVKQFLSEGRTVLFTGLPCECAGLRAYLRQPYEKLYICEILCHGAPSPMLFSRYVKYLERRFGSKVTNIVFRDKKKGWRIYQCGFLIEFENREPVWVGAQGNNYFNAFLVDIIQRPSCSRCNYTERNRAGDLTIGDFWGIQKIDKELYDNKGTSLVLLNNRQGENLWRQVEEQFVSKESTLELAFEHNHKKPMRFKAERNELFERYWEEKKINDLLQRYNLLRRSKSK